MLPFLFASVNGSVSDAVRVMSTARCLPKANGSLAGKQALPTKQGASEMDASLALYNYVVFKLRGWIAVFSFEGSGKIFFIRKAASKGDFFDRKLILCQ